MSLTERERAIAELAFRNLEAAIRIVPRKALKWKPMLTATEVARLRRKLTGPPEPELHGAGRLAPEAERILQSYGLPDDPDEE